MAMTKLAVQGDERAARALIEAGRTVPRLYDTLSTLSSLAERSWLELLSPFGPGSGIAR